MGQEPKDCDYVVVGSSPKEMIDKGYTPVGKDFPVFLHPKTKEEYALARKEIKEGRGYTGFKFCWEGVTLEEDLSRRDLTMNAIAMDSAGNLIDPFDGVQDIKNRIIRHVSKYFSEDPLRVLRVARFKARYPNMEICDCTKRLMTEICKSGELNYLTPERVFKEIEKVLENGRADIFLKVLDEVDCLETLFPEIHALKDVPQPKEHHKEGDVFVHTLLSIKEATNPISRFAALCHDFGKAITPKNEWPKHIGHEQNGISIVENFCDRLRVPASWKRIALLVVEHHLRVHRVFEMKPKKVLKLIKNLDALRRDDYIDVIDACKADYNGRGEVREYPQADFLKEVITRIKKIDNKKLLQNVPSERIPEVIYAAHREEVARVVRRS